MPGIDLLRFLCSPLRQNQCSVGFYGDIAFFFQNSHAPGNTGLGISQIVADIHRTGISVFLNQNIDGLQIHFPRFLHTHGTAPFLSFL